MDDRFVTLASLVAATAVPPAPAIVVSGEPPASEAAPYPPPPARSRPMLDLARADIAQELALMRIAALEAFERASAELLTRLAHDVLARELATAPMDLAALAARALADFSEYAPVALCVAPCDANAFDSQLPVRADASLDAGDLIVEVADGVFETRFTMRVHQAIGRVLGEAVR